MALLMTSRSEGNDMKEITDSDDLIVGNLYWLKSKHGAKLEVAICRQYENDKFFNARIWTDNRNPQGFFMWEIYPVEIPSELLQG